jgi:beta-glucanase (GH16 family)
MSINKNKWELVWADDFSGTEIDKSKWCYDIGNGYMDNHERGWVAGWGNDELQFYTDGSKNSFIRNGNLVLRAVKETYKGDVNHTIKKFNYTSTRIKTSGLFSKKYGRFEFRVKFPIGKGIWPAIWLMPQNNVYGAWAASGEIDIAEAKGSNPYSVAGTITYGNVWPSMKLSKEIYNFPDDGKISDYHVYVFEWEPGELRWYVDGNLYFTENLWHTIGIGKADYYTYPAPFDQEFYILLNIAVGGHFDGNPDDTTVFPQEMMVDYVKVYEKKGKYS